MTARENLRRLRESEAELAALEETLLRLDAEAAALGAQGAATAQAELCALADEVRAQRDALRAQRDALRCFRTETTRRILAVETQELRTLLLLYYVDGCTWDQVAAQMNYAVSYVWKLHRAALQQFSASAESGEEKSRMRV